MILTPGITGFVPADESAARHTRSFADFQGMVFHAARMIHATVVRLDPAAAAPNFHSALLETPNGEVTILCNAHYPIVAFAEGRVEMGPVRFRDLPDLRQVIASLDMYLVASATDLCRPLNPDDLAYLGPDELTQLRYWKPQTVGEVVFNWFD